jgi:hypothetical protein
MYIANALAIMLLTSLGGNDSFVTGKVTIPVMMTGNSLSPVTVDAATLEA